MAPLIQLGRLTRATFTLSERLALRLPTDNVGNFSDDTTLWEE